MASKDRILRLKEETRCNILDAAFQIAKEDGWQALSMRKIADAIEYTAPIIYEYFANKDAILNELTIKGYKMLSKDLSEEKSKYETPTEQLEAMWFAYWKFAFKEKELYQLMFGVEMNCCVMKKECPDVSTPSKLIIATIFDLMKDQDPTDEVVVQKYYTFLSVVHGLVSINIVHKGISDEMNGQILKNAICGIIKSMIP